MARRYLVCVAVGTALAVSGCRLGGGTAPNAMASSPAVRLSAMDAIMHTSQQANRVRSFRALSSMSSEFSGRAITMSGYADIRLHPRLAEHWTITKTTVGGRPAGGFQEVLLGDSLYVSLPANDRPGGKRWVRFSLRQMSARSGFDYTSALKGEADPAATVTMLTASQDVRDLGHETVGGVRATHYRGTYSMREALARLDAEHKTGVADYYRRMGLDRMTFDLWVDGRQLPYKVRMATLPGARMRLASTTIYTRYDVPVSISAPPPDQAADGSRFLARRRTPGMPA